MKISINLKDGTIAEKPQPDQNKEIIVGIDLGTTNSLVAFIKNGEPVAIRGKNNSALVPSIVHFSENDGIIVGEDAKPFLTSAPERTIYSAKRMMGKSYEDISKFEGRLGYKIIAGESDDSLVKIQIGDTFYTPVSLSSEILKTLKKRIENSLNAPISKAVITVPAYFNDAQRQATRDAGKLAGLDVLRIINEPTAASLAYGIGLDRDQEKLIAVYDLGGGTFDISILRIQDGIFEVLSTHGNTELGGDDFDRAIVNDILEELELDESAIEEEKALGQTVRLAAEEAKKYLSENEVYETTINGKHYSISKEQFESLIKDLIDNTINSCKQAVKDAQVSLDAIHHVVMVGGSTRVPAVNQAVEAYFKQAPFSDIDPDEVVALGAAIQADVLAGNRKDVLLLDVTPLSLGIETVGGLMDVIIPRNTRVPAKAGRQYTTSIDGQKNLKISVYQGERDLVEHNRKLGEFILKNIPPMAAGIPKIDVHLILDADGILTVRAKELRSNTSTRIEIKSTYGISEEEMGQMLVESIQHAEEDMKARALLEARNEGNNIVQASQKFIVNNADLLGKEQISRIEELTQRLIITIQSGTKDDINLAMTEMNEYTTPLAHIALDKNISESLKGNKI